MSTNYTYKSFKLKKQALRLTIIGDDNKIPLDYAINSAHLSDAILGYNKPDGLLINTNINANNNKIHIFGDKGYQFNENKLSNLLINKKIKMVTPKKKYKKRTYKTKNYKSQRKRIRHSKKMKEGLKKRIVIEHINSILHRSYKRISRVHEKKNRNI